MLESRLCCSLHFWQPGASARKEIHGGGPRLARPAASGHGPKHAPGRGHVYPGVWEWVGLMDGGRGAREYASAFLKKRVLEKSVKASAETTNLFCPSSIRARQFACPEARAMVDVERRGYGAVIGVLVRDAIKDSHVAFLVLVQHIEDLALEVWGPGDACPALEHCVLPLLSEEI